MSGLPGAYLSNKGGNDQKKEGASGHERGYQAGGEGPKERIDTY